MPSQTRVERWPNVVALLRQASDLVEQARDEAATELAVTPITDPDRGPRDPRRSLTEAAKYVGSLDYSMNDLRRKADRIDPTTERTPDHA